MRTESVSSQGDGFIHGDNIYRLANDGPESSPVTVERKLIKNGSVEFEVSDVELTKKSITQLTSAFGGYVSTDNQNNYSGSPRYDQTVQGSVEITGSGTAL